MNSTPAPHPNHSLQPYAPYSLPFTPTHFHILTTLLTLTLPIITALYIHHDYKTFLSLGPGGTPSTPLGYLKIKLLSLVSLRDVHRPIHIPPHFRPQKGYLSSLPTRSGTRPLVLGIAPQRQRTQKSNPNVYEVLVARMKSLARIPENQLEERTSCFEKHSSGLFASVPITRTCGGEVCHAHPSDGSLHMSLHPADSKLVLENGWGERHPLAKGGWFRRFVPREFTLVYAPRDERDVEVVMGLVAASVWWVSGLDVGSDGPGNKCRDVDVAAMMGENIESGCGACEMHGRTNKKAEKMTGNA